MGALNSFNLKHKFVKATRLTYTGETQDQSLGQEDPLGKGMATHSSIFFFFSFFPAYLPWEFHRQRSLAGYNSWGRKESYTTEQLTLIYIDYGEKTKTFKVTFEYKMEPGQY